MPRRSESGWRALLTQLATAEAGTLATASNWRRSNGERTLNGNGGSGRGCGRPRATGFLGRRGPDEARTRHAGGEGILHPGMADRHPFIFSAIARSARPWSRSLRIRRIAACCSGMGTSSPASPTR